MTHDKTPAQGTPVIEPRAADATLHTPPDLRWTLHLHGLARIEPPPAGASGARQPLLLIANDAALLAAVALGSGVSSAWLAQLIWPQVDEKAALNNLRQRLFRLRKASGARLLETGPTLLLAPDLCWSAPRFDDEGEGAVADSPGEFLGALAYDEQPDLAAWVAEQRRQWRERRRDAWAGLAAQAQAAGELVAALRHAQRLLADDPLSEHAHRRVMQLHYLRGDRAAAVAAFEHCERRLKDELGLAPSAETLALLSTVERTGLAVTVAPLAAAPPPATLLRPPRTVGRAAEAAQLAQALSSGGIAVLVGDAGIGKTRLLQDLALVQPGHIVYTQARPGDAHAPYAALARVLQRLAASHPEAKVDATVASSPSAPVAAAQAQLAAALAHGMTALIVDDLHFSDRASLEGLRSLIDAEPLAGLRWVFAHRPIASGQPDALLLQALAEAPRARWIQVAPLGEAALAELVADLALPGVRTPAQVQALAQALLQHTGGNPLYLLETLKAARVELAQAARAAGADAGVPLVLPRPGAITHLIDRRLQRLSEQALALGRVAALAGPSFTTELAEQALGTPALQLADAWAELEAADVLRGSAFAHDLVRDGMLRATPQPIAEHAHRLIARHLADQGGDPARIAAHWEAGQRPAQAALCWLAAAEQARCASREREQAELLLQAAQAFRNSGDADAAAQASTQAVPPLLRGAGTAAALALSEQLTRELAGSRHEAAAWLQHAKACLWSGRFADSEAAGRRALVLATTDSDTVQLEARLYVAQACGVQGRAAEGLTVLAGLDDGIDTLADLRLRIEICSAYENLMIQADRPTELPVWMHRHLAYAKQAGDQASQMTALMNLQAHALRQGDLEPGIAHARAAAAAAPAGEQARALASWSETGLGFMLCGLGRYGDGLAVLERELAYSLGASAQAAALTANQEQWLAQVWITLGQTARAQALIASDEGIAPGARRAKRLMVRAALQQALGQRVQAKALWQEALEQTDPLANRWDQIVCHIHLADHAEPAGAIEACLDLARQSTARDYHVLTVLAEAAGLRAHLRSGSLREAERPLLQRVEADACRWRHPIASVPALLLDVAEAWLALGEREGADRCLRAAHHEVYTRQLPQVPEAFRHGFLNRNADNLRLQAAWARHRT
jgi:DNA-binding SARP family transcriptional activator